jgi:TonB family protein
MNRPLLALVALLWTTASIFAQEPQLAIAELEAPVYPRMALAARVWGDVILNVTIASDGSVNGVNVESGPPMLRQAAINSATRSRFQAALENRTGGYRLVYRFVLDQTTKCEHDDSYPRVEHEENLVTITEQNVPICDPAAVIERVRFRSAKCLYLWKCGSKTP